MKAQELKKLIRECVLQSVTELKEEFEHIRAPKNTLNKNNPSSPDGVDAGDKKMGPECGNPPKAVKNASPKEEKGAMNQELEKKTEKDRKVLPEKKEKDQKKQEMKEAKKEQKKQKVEQSIMAPATSAPARQPAPAPISEDIEVEIPLPAGRQGREASVEVVPGEEGEGDVAELIIVDDSIQPEDINPEMIQIEIPDREVERGQGQEVAPQMNAEVPQGEVAPEREIPAVQGQEGGDEFDRFADLAGVKK